MSPIVPSHGAKRLLRAASLLAWLVAAFSLDLPLALADQNPVAAEPAAKGAPPVTALRSEPVLEADAGGVADEEDDAPNARTELNLLGEVDTESGESRRNENVQLTLVDNNVQKELNIRMGTSATITREFKADHGYFGTEFGNPPQRQIHVKPLGRRDFHGSLYESHGNSHFSARSFFQVGDVQPARQNDYGAQVSVPLWSAAALTLDVSQQRNRGNVNGNVLIPLPEERSPLVTDPDLRAIVSRIFGAFPDVPPNRADINPRAHNTNAPQEIDNDVLGGRIDLPEGKNHFVADYRFRKQHVEAFQLIKGQNPNTTTGSHAGRMTWNRAWSPVTTGELSIQFRRVTSLIVQDETAIGPVIWMGRQLETIGGTTSIPYDRVQNFFGYAGALNTTKGNHQLVAGFNLVREQLNGIESSGHVGLVMFAADFGRDMITNLRHGTPSRMSQAIGNPRRGFRRWRAQHFVGDKWSALPNLTLNLGFRYEVLARPGEVNALSDIPYACDCNNFAPTFGFAYRTPAGILRGAYGVQFGEIFTATYSQYRFNPPGNLRLSLVAPDLRDPLKGFSSDTLDPNARSTVLRLAPDMVSPYSHQYNFSWEMAASSGAFMQLGYVGSRSHKLLSGWVLNRAPAVAGVPQTTRTVNQRRPDQRYFDIRHILNGSRAYFDAGKATVGIRGTGGLTVDFSYWMSKAIDLGAHYANNATTRDAFMGRSQTEFDVHGDVKGLSSFDQTHAALARFTYRTPAIRGASTAIDKVFGRWDLHSIMLLKTGTPFVIQTGSDGPGFGNVDGVAGDRPRLLDPSVLGRTIDHPDTSRQLLPRTAFGFLRPGDLQGDIGRNVVRKDGIQNVNFAVARSWKIAGENALMFRAEAINLFNTPQFAFPGNDLSGGNFGQITNTLNDGRTFNLTMRLSF